jgi:hypothetical protein
LTLKVREPAVNVEESGWNECAKVGADQDSAHGLLDFWTAGLLSEREQTRRPEDQKTLVWLLVCCTRRGFDFAGRCQRTDKQMELASRRAFGAASATPKTLFWSAFLRS